MIPEIANRLRKRHKHLRKWARRQGITCYRLYERDIPDQPLIVDWYDGDAVVWLQRRTRNETPEQEQQWQQDVLASVAAGLDLPPERIHDKTRRGQRKDGRGQYQRTGAEGAVKVVEEQSIQAEVNLSDYLDTGMFLDHRPLRHWVQEHGQGRRVLNLFCYTGLFSVHAAKGGAVRTVSVDLSNTYLEWAQRNLALNGLDGPQHQFVRHDCLEYLRQVAEGSRRYDLIICDPPTFSNSKKTRDDFQVARAQHDLIHGCMRVLDAGGTLFFSNNYRGFKLDLAIAERYCVEEISDWTVPEDFRNRHIHRCWRITHRET